MRPTWWQVLILAGLVALHLSPYFVIRASSGGLEFLHWVLWGLLSGPYAQGSILGFVLLAGGMTGPWRRLIVMAGIVTIMALCLWLLDGDMMLLAVSASMSLLVVAVGGWMASKFLTDLPSFPFRRIHFALWEILSTMGIVGVLFGLLRLSNPDAMSRWTDLFAPDLLIYALGSGLLGLVGCFAVTATSRKRFVAWLVASILFWGILPWAMIWLASLSGHSMLDWSAQLFVLYPALAVQALMIWGTLFPLKYGFPGFIREGRATIAAKRLDPPADQPSESDDFAEIT